jgi:hypothetical protein
MTNHPHRSRAQCRPMELVADIERRFPLQAIDKLKELWYAYSIKRGATEPRRKGRRGMAGTITAKKTIRCANCGCGLRRTKQIKITATTQEEFTIEVQAKVAAWEKSLEGQNCAICQDAFDLFQRKGKYAQQ